MATRLTDALEQLEHDLAKYPGDSASDLLNRRLVLRKALDAHGRERYDEGHRDGIRDALDTRYEAQSRADEADKNGAPNA
jgi:hypothetical protein